MSVSEFLGKVELWFAKFMVSRGTEDRVRFYQKLQSLLKNNFSLMDAMNRIWEIESRGGKNPGEPMAIAIKMWQSKIQNGEPLAIAMRGWAPPRETLMLSVGDVGSLDGALGNVVKVIEGNQRIVGPLVSALVYPSFLLLLTVGIIVMVGLYMVPPLMDAAPGIRWKDSAETLVNLSGFVTDYWWIFPTGFGIAVLIIMVSFPRWVGKSRLYVENVPPWSMYRMFVGVSWMLSMAALIKAGMPLSKALHALKMDASPYLLERIDAAIEYVNNGDNIGTALYRSGLGFPDEEIIGDLRVYAELDNFDTAIENIANDCLESSIKKIGTQAEILNTVAILMVSLTIAWVVLGTFAMQDQVTSTM